MQMKTQFTYEWPSTVKKSEQRPYRTVKRT